jgi:hypothetical protein
MTRTQACRWIELDESPILVADPFLVEREPLDEHDRRVRAGVRRLGQRQLASAAVRLSGSPWNFAAATR